MSVHDARVCTFVLSFESSVVWPELSVSNHPNEPQWLLLGSQKTKCLEGKIDIINCIINTQQPQQQQPSTNEERCRDGNTVKQSDGVKHDSNANTLTSTEC